MGRRDQTSPGGEGAAANASQASDRSVASRSTIAAVRREHVGGPEPARGGRKPPGEYVSFGAGLIAEERRRQVEVEGWTEEHDDDHAGPALALAGICYAAAATDVDIREFDEDDGDFRIRDPWPWGDRRWDKREKHARRGQTEEKRRSGRIRCLVIAGALLAAEIDRLLRERRQPRRRDL